LDNFLYFVLIGYRDCQKSTALIVSFDLLIFQKEPNAQDKECKENRQEEVACSASQTDNHG